MPGRRSSRPRRPRPPVTVRRRRHRRRGHRTERTRSGRLGDRGDDRSADEVREDRRHRRSRAGICSRTCRRRAIACGSVDTDWSIRRRSRPRRARPSTSPRSSRRTPKAAAHYYPAGYWFSLMRVPRQARVRGHRRRTATASTPSMRGQADWIRSVKSGGCLACHQLGNKATREIPRELGAFPTSVAAWERRVQSGQAGGRWRARLNQFGRERILAEFADWTDRIAAASCRRRRRARRGPSATSSSPSGTGPIRRPTCTTWSRPIAAIRPSTRTVRSTARWS